MSSCVTEPHSWLISRPNSGLRRPRPSRTPATILLSPPRLVTLAGWHVLPRPWAHSLCAMRSASWSPPALPPTTRSRRCAKSSGPVRSPRGVGADSPIRPDGCRRVRAIGWPHRAASSDCYPTSALASSRRAWCNRALGWIGRWSLVGTPGTLGPQPPEEEHAAAIAHQWLERYGVVTRDWWRRERPPVGWHAIYRELKRLEYRGEVRRGYFVEGLGGAQFALPDAVERLRAARDDVDAPFVVMAASDPANVYSLPPSRLGPVPPRDPLTRPRGAGAILVMRRGSVVMAAEGRGRRLRLAPALDDEAATRRLSALTAYLAAGGTRHRSRTLETIDDVPAATTPHIAIFRRAGFRMGGMGLDWGFAPIESRKSEIESRERQPRLR